jgi:uncharacterized DUF497 family protein
MNRGFRWNAWNLEHISVHDVSQEEVESLVIRASPPYPEPIGDEKWRVRGQIGTGRYLQVIFLYDPDDTVFVIHARDLSDHEKRRLRRRTR